MNEKELNAINNKKETLDNFEIIRKLEGVKAQLLAFKKNL